jgi:glycine cleavage system transcriptional repressor
MSNTAINANQLVISAIGDDRPGIVNQLSQLIVENKGNIDDSRMSVLGGEFAIILLISATVKDLDNIEQLLIQQATSLQLNIITKHTQAITKEHHTKQEMPYIVDILAMDNPGIVYQLSDFFSARNINIQSLHTNRYSAPHTGTQMFAIEMIITITTDINIYDLREEFLKLCDSMNLDASIEASRG